MVYPESREEVVEVLRFANERRVPVVPFGEGSSLEAHTLPVHGGISLDLGRMNRVLEVRPDDFIARVEPGVTHGALNAALAEYGLFFPVDPGWDASLGGMAGTNASGTNAVKYGVMRDQVLGLEVVLGDGTVMRTGGLAMKSSAGYHLTGLFVGSEGTLGVFTELILRLYPIPESTVAARAVFPDIEAAGRAAVAMIRTGMRIGRVELVDARTVERRERVQRHRLRRRPDPLPGVQRLRGRRRARRGRRARRLHLRGLCLVRVRGGRGGAREAVGGPPRRSPRHPGPLPGQGMMGTDVCVPISDLPGALRHARDTIASRGLDGAILGHVGDGNYHAVFPVDTADRDDRERAEEVNAEIVDYALERGGTCTGEHGIGLGKTGYLQREHGDSLPFMRGIKKIADPNGIMNPGKVFAQ